MPFQVTIAQCVGGPGLAAVCHLLAHDHSGWSGEIRSSPREVYRRPEGKFSLECGRR